MKLTINQLLQQGISAHKNNNLEEAERLYHDILLLDLLHPHANHNLALIAISKNKSSDAFPLFRAAIKGNPNIENIWINYIHTLLIENLTEECEMNCKKLITLQPDSAKAYFYLAETLYKLNRLKEAEIKYRKAIQLKDDFVEAYNNLGSLLLKLNKLKESEELCRKAIELKPDFVDAYRNLGDTLKRLDKFDDAIMSYNKAITLNPNFIEVYNLLGVTFNLIDKHEEAEKNFNKAIELKPDYEEAHVNLSIMLRQNKILKKILNFRKEKKIDKKLINTNSSVSSSNMLTSNPFISSRFVEAELINNLYEINSKSLDKTNGVFFGKGRHSSDFDLFKSNYPIIKTVEEDLINVMKQAVNSEVQIIDSFFNILGAGGGSNPHHHLNSFDKVNKLIYQKYSLTYYLSVGDQNCNEPGLLKLKDPDEEILPSVGMIMIFPANRTHSAVYGGKTDRVMIGINFYSII